MSAVGHAGRVLRAGKAGALGSFLGRGSDGTKCEMGISLPHMSRGESEVKLESTAGLRSSSKEPAAFLLEVTGSHRG